MPYLLRQERPLLKFTASLPSPLKIPSRSSSSSLAAGGPWRSRRGGEGWEKFLREGIWLAETPAAQVGSSEGESCRRWNSLAREPALP